MDGTLSSCRYFIFISIMMCGAVYSHETGGPFWRTKVDQLASCYDFIIVGAGSAGCRLAEKLSAVQSVNVLVLEAGGAPAEFTSIPLMTKLAFRTDAVQVYRVEPMENAFISEPNKPQILVTGRVVGGGSTINLMNYERGSLHDYDLWEKEFRADGWSGREMFRYFRADENNADYELTDEAHGRHGAFHVTSSYDTNILRGFFAASEEKGYPVRDTGNGNVEGVYRMQANIDTNGRRSSAFTAFIRPHLGTRRNLHVATGAFVTKIIFERTTNPNVTVAHAVEFIMEGVRRKVCARKEIILSAGAIETPHILMLSGIGPKDHLEEMKIDLVADLPVGLNLQNHVAVRGISGAINETSWQEIPSVNDIGGLMQWHRFGTGPFTSPMGTHLGVGFFKMNQSDFSPDIEIMLQGLRDEVPGCGSQSDKEDSVEFSLLSILMRPKSRGKLRLRNADPHTPPVIHLNYFDNPDDIDILSRGAKFAAELLKTKSFAGIGVTYTTAPVSACQNETADSLDYWRCFVKVNTASMAHPSGTCRMGAKEREDTVVDSMLRVKGVQGLRVADCSVMPQINTGHTNAPAIAIGARAGDLILKQHGLVW